MRTYLGIVALSIVSAMTVGVLALRRRHGLIRSIPAGGMVCTDAGRGGRSDA
jgi:hypothetical protein